MRRKTVPLVLVTAIGVALTAALSGCGAPQPAPTAVAGDQDALIEAAKAEGSLTLYSGETQDDIDRVAGAFTEEYGIPVEVIRLSTGELNQRYSSEASAGSVLADVLIGSDPRIYADETEWFAPLTGDDVPGLDEYPENSRTTDSYASLVYVFSIAYNTDLVSESDAPTGWEDLLDPAFSGKLLMNDPRATPAYIGWLDAMQKAFGDEFLEGLAAQKPALAPTASTGAQQVAAGESAVNFPSQPHQTTKLVEGGAPIANNAVLDPPVAYAMYLGVAAEAPHPNAARLFASWRLSDAGQEVLCATGTVATPISGSERGCLDLPDGWELISTVDETRTNELLDLVGIDG